MNGPWHYDRAEWHEALAWKAGASEEETANRLASANFHARMAQTAALLELSEHGLSAGRAAWMEVLNRTSVPCGFTFDKDGPECVLAAGHSLGHQLPGSEAAP